MWDLQISILPFYFTLKKIFIRLSSYVISCWCACPENMVFTPYAFLDAAWLQEAFVIEFPSDAKRLYHRVCFKTLIFCCVITHAVRMAICEVCPELGHLTLINNLRDQNYHPSWCPFWWTFVYDIIGLDKNGDSTCVAFPVLWIYVSIVGYR